MLFPVVIDPRDLLQEGQQLDEERENTCICGNVVKLGNVKLVWLDMGDGYGYRAICSQTCHLSKLQMGGES